jgi:hypothetical protein
MACPTPHLQQFASYQASTSTEDRRDHNHEHFQGLRQAFLRDEHRSTMSPAASTTSSNIPFLSDGLGTVSLNESTQPVSQHCVASAALTADCNCILHFLTKLTRGDATFEHSPHLRSSSGADIDATHMCLSISFFEVTIAREATPETMVD